MKKSKKIFLWASLLFFAFVALISYDFSTRTTFPGAKLEKEEMVKGDTIRRDSVSIKSQ